MGGTIEWVSLMIRSELQSATLDVRHLGEPAHPDPEVSASFPGVLFHEATHFWQVMASGFLCCMASEEWTRLLAWLDGARLPAGPFRKKFDTIDPVAGFSPRALTETLARMWEVHVGDKAALIERGLKYDTPERNALKSEYARLKRAGAFDRADDAYPGEVFDLALRAVGGAYAVPYLRVRDVLGSYRAAAVLPVIGHFALQTSEPAANFLLLIDPAVAALPKLMPDAPIHETWRRLYCDLRARRWSGPALLTGSKVMGQPPLDTHPVYSWAKARIHAVEDGELPLAEGCDIRTATPAAPDAWVRYVALDRMLALPGDPVARPRLIKHLPPVAIRYRDGSSTPVAAICRRYFGEGGGDPSDEELAMAESYRIDEAWRAFVRGESAARWRREWDPRAGRTE